MAKAKHATETEPVETADAVDPTNLFADIKEFIEAFRAQQWKRAAQAGLNILQFAAQFLPDDGSDGGMRAKGGPALMSRSDDRLVNDLESHLATHANAQVDGEGDAQAGGGGAILKLMLPIILQLVQRLFAK